MTLLAISDLHLNPQTDQRSKNFLDFLKEATASKSEVLIAGDLFDLWLGPPRLTFSYQQSILEEMRSLVSSGLALYYVEGNRDFLISAVTKPLFSQMANKALKIRHNHWMIKAVHGDLINRKDRLYRCWRFISKNPLSLFLLKNLPARFVQTSSERVERELKPTNQKHKSYFPEQEIQYFMRSAGAEGFDLVIAGHFHLEREIEIQWNEKSVLFYSLPGWEYGLRYLVIPENGERPYFEGK